jgi:hypothetical protein
LPQVVAQRFFGTELMPLWRRHGAAIRALEAAEEEAESRWRQAQARRFAQRLWVHFVSIYVIHCHTVLYHRFMSYYIIVDIRSFHFISFRFVSYHFISYHIISYIINMSYIYVINNEILQIMIYLCHVTFDMFV